MSYLNRTYFNDRYGNKVFAESPAEIELYNLKDDLQETTNLAESNPEVASGLLKELVEWRRVNKVPLPKASALDI